MNLECRWSEKMKFSARSGAHHISMDTKPPLGDDSAMTPKQLLLAGVCGCTAMDVVSLLKKHKQPLESLQVDADAQSTEGVYPAIFKKIHLVFKLTGKLDSERVVEAVHLSQTKYCGVSAMVSKAVPITYSIEVNGSTLGSGKADFS